jgi:hypothetical protein
VFSNIIIIIILFRVKNPQCVQLTLQSKETKIDYHFLK